MYYNIHVQEREGADWIGLDSSLTFVQSSTSTGFDDDDDEGADLHLSLLLV